jgi:hypothetical protein
VAWQSQPFPKYRTVYIEDNALGSSLQQSAVENQIYIDYALYIYFLCLCFAQNAINPIEENDKVKPGCGAQHPYQFGGLRAYSDSAEIHPASPQPFI